MPVGEAGPPAPGGIATTSDCATPLPSYSVDVLLPRLLTHTNAAGLKATPQAFTRLTSTWTAPPRLESATSLPIEYAVAAGTVDVVVAGVVEVGVGVTVVLCGTVVP